MAGYGLLTNDSSNFKAGNDYIGITLSEINGSGELGLKARITKNGVTTWHSITDALPNATWVYLALTYDAGTDKFYVVYNDTITDLGVIGGSWAGGTWTNLRLYPCRDYVWNSLEINAFFDELTYCYDYYIPPEIWAQHYTHNVPWNTDFSKEDMYIGTNVK